MRELTQKRVWFAEPLITATADDVRRWIIKAKEWYMLWTRTPRIPSRPPRKTCLPYRKAGEPPCQKRALDRRRIMRKARSKKKRPLILADLKRHYRETLNF